MCVCECVFVCTSSRHLALLTWSLFISVLVICLLNTYPPPPPDHLWLLLGGNLCYWSWFHWLLYIESVGVTPRVRRLQSVPSLDSLLHLKFNRLEPEKRGCARVRVHVCSFAKLKLEAVAFFPFWWSFLLSLATVFERFWFCARGSRSCKIKFLMFWLHLEKISTSFRVGPIKWSMSASWPQKLILLSALCACVFFPFADLLAAPLIFHGPLFVMPLQASQTRRNPGESSQGAGGPPSALQPGTTGSDQTR